MITICKNINVHTNLCCSPLTNTTAAIITTSAPNSRGNIIPIERPAHAHTT